jgi:hypothetical protein
VAQPATMTLDQMPVDAPADDAVITVWNGERWVAYDKWLTAMVEDQFRQYRSLSK